MKLVPCESCGRHVRDTERSCVFCSASLREGASLRARVLAGAAIALVAAGCNAVRPNATMYGGPPVELTNPDGGLAPAAPPGDAAAPR